jgi:hypothetical protein
MPVGRIILRPGGPIFIAQLFVSVWVGATAVGVVIDGRWGWAATLLPLMTVLIVRWVMSGLAVVDQCHELVARTPFRSRRVPIAEVDVAFFSRPLTRDGLISKLVLRGSDGRRFRVAAVSVQAGAAGLATTVPPKLYMRKARRAAIARSLAALGIMYVDHEPS